AALDRVDLARRLRTRGGAPLDVPCSALSVGEAQRIAIGRALARDAELLVLDEPEAGLDPASRAELRTLLESLAGEGKHIVLASQHEDVVPAGSQRIILPVARGTIWPAPRPEPEPERAKTE
ncbi:MAG: AAA family ATPase, partial [Polyangiales bacterium]